MTMASSLNLASTAVAVVVVQPLFSPDGDTHNYN